MVDQERVTPEGDFPSCTIALSPIQCCDVVGQGQQEGLTD